MRVRFFHRNELKVAGPAHHTHVDAHVHTHIYRLGRSCGAQGGTPAARAPSD